jgi:hypothetical protein
MLPPSQVLIKTVYQEFNLLVTSLAQSRDLAKQTQDQQSQAYPISGGDLGLVPRAFRLLDEEICCPGASRSSDDRSDNQRFRFPVIRGFNIQFSFCHDLAFLVDSGIFGHYAESQDRLNVNYAD